MVKTLIFKRKKIRLEYFRDMLIFSVLFAGTMTAIEQLFKPYFYDYSELVQTNSDKDNPCPDNRGSGRRDCLSFRLTSTMD